MLYEIGLHMLAAAVGRSGGHFPKDLKLLGTICRHTLSAVQFTYAPQFDTSIYNMAVLHNDYKL